MAMFGTRSAGTTYDDHDSPPSDSHPERRLSHQQRAGLAAIGDVMSTWTAAFTTLSRY